MGGGEGSAEREKGSDSGGGFPLLDRGGGAELLWELNGGGLERGGRLPCTSEPMARKGEEWGGREMHSVHAPWCTCVCCWAGPWRLGSLPAFLSWGWLFGEGPQRGRGPFHPCVPTFSFQGAQGKPGKRGTAGPPGPVVSSRGWGRGGGRPVPVAGGEGLTAAPLLSPAAGPPWPAWAARRRWSQRREGEVGGWAGWGGGLSNTLQPQTAVPRARAQLPPPAAASGAPVSTGRETLECCLMPPRAAAAAAPPVKGWAPPGVGAEGRSSWFRPSDWEPHLP